MQADINYWAVLLCAVASMVLGFVYYGPLFGKLYSRLAGFDQLSEDQRKEMMKGMGTNYFLAFVGSLVLAYVFARFLGYANAFTGAQGVSGGLQAAFWAWLGFMATVTLSNVLWGRQSWTMWFLGNGYNLIQLLIFGIILGSWL